jgi:hypothetical protein
MKTKVVITDFGRHKLFTVRRLNSSGEIIEEIKPIVSMGIVKAKAIIDNLDEFKQFIKDNEK